MYFISSVEVPDKDKTANCRRPAPAAVAAHGGRFLTRAGKTTLLEGEWNTARGTTIIEFPEEETLNRWYHGPEYQAAKRGREGVADSTPSAFRATPRRSETVSSG